MKREQASALASGTVWSGAAALKLGLVDELGGLQGAIAAAAELAGIEGDYDTVRLEEAPSPLDAFLLELAGSVGSPLVALQPAWLREAEAMYATGESLLPGLGALIRREDPQGVYAYCLVCAAPRNAPRK